MSLYKKIKSPKTLKPRKGCFSLFFNASQTSVLKLMCTYVFAYLIASYAIQGLYQFVLDVASKELIKEIRGKLMNPTLDQRVIVVMLAIYMAKMVDRMTETCKLVRFPDELLVAISSAIPGYTKIHTSLKSKIVRYVLASYVLTLNKISYSVQRKFPDLSTIVNAGILNTYESGLLKIVEPKRLEYREPLDWAGELVTRGRSDNLMRGGAMEILLRGLTTQTDAMSRLLAHEQVGTPFHYTIVVYILILMYNVFSFVNQIIPMEGDLAEPLTFVLNPISAAILYGCYHGVLKLANMISQPLGLKRDHLDLDQIIDDHIEAVNGCFRKMLSERQDDVRDQWYDHALAEEMSPWGEANVTALEEHVEHLYEPINPVDDEPNVASDMQVSRLMSGESQTHHTAQVHEPGESANATVQVIEERKRSHQHQLRPEQQEEGLSELDTLRANQRPDAVNTGEALAQDDEGTNDHYVDIEAVLQSENRTNPAIRCEKCFKFCMTDETVRGLEEKTKGFDDISKYKKLQCQCPKAVWV